MENLIMIVLQESSMNVRTNVRMQRGFRVKRCSTNWEQIQIQIQIFIVVHYLQNITLTIFTEIT